MKVTLQDIQTKLEALISGLESREDIADFATQAMEANDSRTLEMERGYSDKIWDAILYMSGVDLKDEPDRYLHSVRDFAEYRSGLGI